MIWADTEAEKLATLGGPYVLAVALVVTAGALAYLFRAWQQAIERTNQTLQEVIATSRGDLKAEREEHARELEKRDVRQEKRDVEVTAALREVAASVTGLASRLVRVEEAVGGCPSHRPLNVRTP